MTNEWRPIRDEYLQAKEAFAATNGDDDRRAAWRAEAGIFDRLVSGRLIGRASFPMQSIYDPGRPSLSFFENNGTISQAFWQEFRDAQAHRKTIDWAAGDFWFSVVNYAPNGDCARELEAKAFEVVVAPSTDLSQSRLEVDTSTSVREERRGAPRKWDWEGALIQVVATANSPDGLPEGHGAQAEIGRILRDWFQLNQGGEPAQSEIGKRAAKIMAAIGK